MENPKIRFKGFTKDWEQRKLADVVDYVDTGKSKFDKEGSSGEYPILGSTSVIGYDDEYDYEGDFILTARVGANAGSLYRHTGKVKISDNTVFIQASQNIEFLYQLLIRFDIKKLSFGTGQPLVKASELKSLELMMPTDMKEQMQIGEYFKSLDHLITLHQRKCEQTKKLKKYMLQKMFPQNGAKVPEIRFDGFTYDWEQRKLGDLVISHNAGIYISKEDYGTGTNVIGVGNIYDNDIFDGEIYRLGPVTDEKFLLEENDLIYGESSLVPEGIARTVCVGKNGVGSAFAWHTRRVKLDQSVINSHFATLELNYNVDVRRYLISVSTQTALTGMTTEGYFGGTLSLPTVEEQAHISSLFKQLDHLITLHQRKCDELKKMKKYMLQNMFI